MKKFIPFLFVLVALASFAAPTTVTFPSKDGVTITADIYTVNDTLPWMLLCHQAGSSRGEYKDLAKRFMKLGYNCMAIDQRSGKECNGVINQTALDAVSKKKDTEYLDAEQDIVAALDYLYKKSNKPVVLVGSSYSASLVLKIAAGNPKVSLVMAFSPGEYFGKKLKLKESIQKLDKPTYVACSQQEKSGCDDLMKNVATGDKVIFSPGTGGEHGAKALTKSNPNHTDYWMSVMMFLHRN